VPGAAPSPGPGTDAMISELYRAHYRSLVRVAALLVRDTATAEHVVQDVFVAVYRGWPRLRSSDKVLSYLRKAVVNQSRSALRHRAVADKYPPKPPPAAPSAAQAAMTGLERSAVVASLRRLPARQREALVLRYYADLSDADTAAAMGISRGAVKSHTARGMSALRTVLEECERPVSALLATGDRAGGRSPSLGTAVPPGASEAGSGSAQRQPGRRAERCRAGGQEHAGPARRPGQPERADPLAGRPGDLGRGSR
jgi:RNA polymerase sigma-70 factor (sigma-E family)